MNLLRQVVLLSIGSSFIALGLNGFLVPHGLLEGGALGMSLIIHYVFGTKVGMTFFLISVPIFIFAWLRHRPFFHSGIHGMVASSLMIDWFAPIRDSSVHMTWHPIILAGTGGILIGIGTGIMLRYGISIGGTDLLAQLVARELNVNSGLVILLVDTMIVSIGSFIILSVSFLYSLITVVCVGVVISLMVYRGPILSND